MLIILESISLTQILILNYKSEPMMSNCLIVLGILHTHTFQAQLIIFSYLFKPSSSSCVYHTYPNYSSNAIKYGYLSLKSVHFFSIRTAAITPDQTPTISQMADYSSLLTSVLRSIQHCTQDNLSEIQDLTFKSLFQTL